MRITHENGIPALFIYSYITHTTILLLNINLLKATGMGIGYLGPLWIVISFNFYIVANTERDTIILGLGLFHCIYHNLIMEKL